jgi:hypothetical protein
MCLNSKQKVVWHQSLTYIGHSSHFCDTAEIGHQQNNLHVPPVYKNTDAKATMVGTALCVPQDVGLNLDANNFT